MLWAGVARWYFPAVSARFAFIRTLRLSSSWPETHWLQTSKEWGSRADSTHKIDRNQIQHNLTDVTLLTWTVMANLLFLAAAVYSIVLDAVVFRSLKPTKIASQTIHITGNYYDNAIDECSRTWVYHGVCVLRGKAPRVTFWPRGNSITSWLACPCSIQFHSEKTWKTHRFSKHLKTMCRKW